MAELFQRSYSLTVGTVKIARLRIEFKATKTTGKEPNACEIKITNLAAKTRAQLTGRGVPVILSAGYGGNDAVIFSGDSRTIDHLGGENAEFITHIQCGDGERAYVRSNFSAGFGPGTQVTDVIRACAKTLSLNLGNLEDALSAGNFRGNLTTFQRGYSAHGKSVEVFDSLLKSVGLTWSIQSGALMILKGGKPVNQQAVLLTPDTGLIGSPDHAAPDKKGGKSVLKVRCLLQPQIRCGGIVDLQSVGFKGQFTVTKLVHYGDTHGPEWYSLVEGETL